MVKLGDETGGVLDNSKHPEALEHQGAFAHSEYLLQIVEERSRTLEAQLSDLTTLVKVSEARSRTLENQLHTCINLLTVIEQRSQTLENGQTRAMDQINAVDDRLITHEQLLADVLTLQRTTEERSRTLEYQITNAALAIDFERDLLHKWYVELVGRSNKPGTTGRASELVISLETAHPIAADSNDHLSPESTVEGIVRPTRFVRHCIEILGDDILCLDLGTGAAGLVYEYVANGLVAVGIDGSDYCRRNKVGYWPLLPDSLFTCDITKPLQFFSAGNPLFFDLITAWEVLEHINESDLPRLFANVKRHLSSWGYFVGSISFLEYSNALGLPYHVTLKPRSWWENVFKDHGLEIMTVHPFAVDTFCRGNGPRFQDFHNYTLRPDEGFHFVAKSSVIV